MNNEDIGDRLTKARAAYMAKADKIGKLLDIMKAAWGETEEDICERSLEYTRELIGNKRGYMNIYTLTSTTRTHANTTHPHTRTHLTVLSLLHLSFAGCKA